jgi:hypothetical protein
MGRHIHGRWHDDKMPDDSEGYMIDRIGWGTALFFVAAAAVLGWLLWPDLKILWSDFRG